MKIVICVIVGFIVGFILCCMSEFFCGMFPQHEKYIVWAFGVIAGALAHYFIKE